MFDTRMKSRTSTFIGLGLSAVTGLTVEAAASTCDGPGSDVRGSIERMGNPPMPDHAHYGVTGVSSISTMSSPLPPGPWSGR